jgi:hypothetical protein
MNYLQKAIRTLLGGYYTPEKVVKKIEFEYLLINPPYKQDGYIK